MNVLLPVAGQAAEAVPEPSPAREQTRGHGEAILLVEDERSLRSMAGRILARNGYQVREAVDGRRGDPAGQRSRRARRPAAHRRGDAGDARQRGGRPGPRACAPACPPCTSPATRGRCLTSTASVRRTWTSCRSPSPRRSCSAGCAGRSTRRGRARRPGAGPPRLRVRRGRGTRESHAPVRWPPLAVATRRRCRCPGPRLAWRCSRARRYSAMTISFSSATEVCADGLSKVISPCCSRLIRSQISRAWP